MHKRIIFLLLTVLIVGLGIYLSGTGLNTSVSLAESPTQRDAMRKVDAPKTISLLSKVKKTRN